MIKVIGAILLIAGTAAWGITGVFRLRGRCRSLTAITRALGAMQSEICDRLTPMPELLLQMGEEAGAPADVLFRNAAEMMSELGTAQFSVIWRRAIERTPELLLTREEETVLTELGMSLGRYNVEEQKNALVYTRRRMEEFAHKAELARDMNSKMHAFLGIAAGVFAVVILI